MRVTTSNDKQKAAIGESDPSLCMLMYSSPYAVQKDQSTEQWKASLMLNSLTLTDSSSQKFTPAIYSS